MLHNGAGVAFSSAVHGGVRYTVLLAIQKCGCLHSTMGYGHLSLQTPLYKVNISSYAFHQRGVPLTPWGHSPTSPIVYCLGTPFDHC